jgi:hypothetical protein
MALTVLPMPRGIDPNFHEHAEENRAPAGLKSDPHSKRIVLDLAEWCGRLARLAKLREGGR